MTHPKTKIRALAAALALVFAALPALAENPALKPEPRQDKWWQDRHQSMNERVKQGNVDLIFVGDSITQGWEAAGLETWAEYYADRNAVNLGISGDKTEHVLWRLDNGNIDGISPKLAVVMIGTNNTGRDSAEQIGEGVIAIVKKLREKLPTTKVLLLAIFPRDEKPDTDNRVKIAKANEIAREAVVDGDHVHYLDIGREFLNADGTMPKVIMGDFLHPGVQGYRIEAEAIEPKVAELLGETAAGKLPKGWAAMFNGVDLTGWKGLVEDPEKRAKMTPEELAEKQKAADEVMRAHWVVKDGILHYDGKGENLCSARPYEDFEMLVDWKIEAKGDSGIYLRGSPQVQIWDPDHVEVKGAEAGSGGLYNNKQHPSGPQARADNPIGEWNTFRIRMIGEVVTVWLNDTLVVDNVVMENYWDYSKPIYPIGDIELQNHSNVLWFKNVWVREIPRGDGFKRLFNGKNLDGWEEIGSKDGKSTWAVEDGVLYTTGEEGGGWLSTAKEYGDFELELEFRTPVNGNSGVFIRAPRAGNPAFAGSEIQILDDFGPEYAAYDPPLQPYQYCGSLYATAAPARRMTLPAGVWQKMKIRCEGPRVQIWHNGFEIIDDDMSKHTDKFAEHPGLTRATGYLGLQNHGARVEFRNLWLRTLGEK